MTESFSQILEVAKNLGTPGITIISLALAVAWLARQAISLKRELHQSKVESANALLKIWEELESKKPNVQDPRFDAIRAELLRRFGISSEDPAQAKEIPNTNAPKASDEPSEWKEAAYCFLGAALAQSLRIITLALKVEPVSATKGVTIGIIIAGVIYSFLGGLVTWRILGPKLKTHTYVIAGVLAGSGIPYLISTLTGWIDGTVEQLTPAIAAGVVGALAALMKLI